MKTLFKLFYWIYDLAALAFKKPEDPTVNINDLAEEVGEPGAIDPDKVVKQHHVHRRMKYVPFDTLHSIAKRKKQTRRR